MKVIGQSANALYWENPGNGNGPEIDIAVDPLEGTNFAAKILPGALSVMSIALKGMFNAPETWIKLLSAMMS